MQRTLYLYFVVVSIAVYSGIQLYIVVYSRIQQSMVVVVNISTLFGGKRKINYHRSHLTVGPENELFRHDRTKEKGVLSKLVSKGQNNSSSCSAVGGELLFVHSRCQCCRLCQLSNWDTYKHIGENCINKTHSLFLSEYFSKFYRID